MIPLRVPSNDAAYMYSCGYWPQRRIASPLGEGTVDKKGSVYSFRVDPSPGGGWTVWFPDLPGCSGWAETLEDVGTEAKTIVGIWLDAEHRRRHPIPPPTDYASQEKWPQGNNVEVAGSGQVIGVPDVAKLLGVSTRRVQALAKERGVGKRFGNYLVFSESDIERLLPGPPGRPRGSGRLSAAVN